MGSGYYDPISEIFYFEDGSYIFYETIPFDKIIKTDIGSDRTTPPDISVPAADRPRVRLTGQQLADAVLVSIDEAA